MSKQNKNERSQARAWLIIIIVLAFTLSIIMNFLSDMLLQKANIVFMFIILFGIILIGILFDIMGVAVTVADEKPFNAMASRKIRGAKSSLILVRNASRVSNICCDVIGDICGIISGASAAYIVAQAAFITDLMSTAVFSMVLSGLVAAMTIGGKAFGKDIAIKGSKNIVIFCGKLLAPFCERGRPKKKEKNSKERSEE